MGKGNLAKVRDVFLASVMLIGETAGIMLCIATVLLQKRLLPGWLEAVYIWFGGILWLALLPVYFCLCAPGKEKGWQKVKAYWLETLKWELWVLVVFCVWRLADKAWLRVWRSFFRSEALYGAVFFLLVFGAVFAASLLVQRILDLCGLGRRVPGPLGAALTFCALYLSLVALLTVSAVTDRFSQLNEASVVSMLAGHVLMACSAYGLMKLFLWVVCDPEPADRAGAEPGHGAQRAGADPQAAGMPGWEPDRAGAALADKGGAERKSAHAGASGIGKAVGAGIPFVLGMALLFLVNGGISLSSATDQAAAAVEECIERAYDSLGKGDLAGAGRQFALGEARARALECLVGEMVDESALYNVYEEKMGDVFIGTLYLSCRGSVAFLEQNVRSRLWGREWYPVLLRFYEELAEDERQGLSAKQESLREELLLKCIAYECYGENGGLFAQDLEEEKLALQKKLTDYEEELALGGLFGLMEQYGAEGGYTEQMAYQALDAAEKHPYNLLLQYMACQIAGNYRTDNAGHYGRVIEAAERFDRIYDDGSRSDEELANAKRFLGNVAARCYDYKTALSYLEETWELSGDTAAALSCARLYERSGEYVQCLELAEDVLREEPENTQALYLAALSALKTGDREKALDAAGRLGDLVADRNRALDAAEENNLYVCAQYLAMTDAGQWTDYTWQIYGSLTEEQAALAQSHELLWHYMTAIYQCFSRNEYEAAEETVKKALALREDLAMGWYLRGTIAFNRESFEEAKGYFEQSLECGGVSPAIYFSLANVYDAMNDYENAWIYAKKVEEMLPYQDHGNDVYGISIHNRNLLDGLRRKLEGQP